MKDVRVTPVFTAWFEALKDDRAKVRIQARVDRVEYGHYGDFKPVGGGVAEMRIHYGPGYRVYFVERGREVVVLLAGGTKASQSKDIKTAIQMADNF